MKKLILTLCLLLALTAAAARAELTDAELERFEYAEIGGMANTSLYYTVEREERTGDVSLIVERDGDARLYPLPRNALSELADFLAGFHPEGWDALPPSELIALDAPMQRISLVYADGTEYTIGDGVEISGPLFYDAIQFLDGYLAEDAQTFELTFSSFYGGGPEYWTELSAPEVVWVESRREHDDPGEDVPPGSEYSTVMIFHGRLPGRTELTVGVDAPLASGDDALPRKVYVLEVDDAWNVTVIDEFDRQG